MFGYVLGILLFFVVPADLIGWVILPIGVGVTLWVVFKKIERKEFKDYVVLGLVWALMAVVLDYLFIVKLLKPEDGYYKLDVYLYYLLALGLPVMVGWMKSGGEVKDVSKEG